MTTLREKVNQTLYELATKSTMALQKDLYQYKVLLAPQHESIFVSFRFHNEVKQYFILSLTVQLKETYPVIIGRISQLCPRRFFVKTLKTIKKEIPKERQIPGIMGDPFVKSHYALHRSLPVELLYDEYRNLIKEEMDEYLSTLDKVQLVW